MTAAPQPPRARRRWRLDAPAGPAWLRAEREAGTGWWVPILLLCAAVAVAFEHPSAGTRHPEEVAERATRARRQELREARAELAAMSRPPSPAEGGLRRDQVRALVAVHRLHASGQSRDLAAAEVELRAAALELDALARVSISGRDDDAWKHVRERLEALDLQENAPHAP